MSNIVDRIKGFLFSPSETFDASKEDTLSSVFGYFITILMIFALLSAIMSWLIFRYGAAMFILVLILGIIGIFIGGLWTHIWVYLVGGRKGIKQTLKALMYGATPGCVLGWIPIVGVFAVVWTLILEIVGIGQLHELSTRRAVLAVIFAISIPLTVPYAATGTWRVGFAMESGSMEPNMHAGDLIFVQAPARTEIITYEEGEALGYKSFDEYGDVIVYRPDGRPSATPILHRAMCWVGKGEEMPNGKPAPHAGYITKGDNNAGFDQPMLGVEPVKPEWVVAVARARIPYLGYPSIILKKGF